MLEQMKISEFYQTVYRVRRIIDKVLSISKHVFEDRIRETRSFFHLSIPREILFQYKRFEDKVGDKIRTCFIERHFPSITYLWRKRIRHISSTFEKKKHLTNYFSSFQTLSSEEVVS